MAKLKIKSFTENLKLFSFAVKRNLKTKQLSIFDTWLFSLIKNHKFVKILMMYQKIMKE